MKLVGLHHITMITGHAQRTIDFYADVLGLRMVKQTVNFDQPEAYHLYFGDEQGAPGSILTWFEFPGASPGRAGAGTIHTLQLGVPTEAVLDFWGERLSVKGHASEMVSTQLGSAHAVAALRFADPDGLAVELVVADDGNPPLRAVHPEIPAQFAITGIEGARAYGTYDAVEEKVLTDTLGFTYEGEGGYVLRGEQRHFHWAHDRAPAHHGLQGAGSVHHIAWASQDADHLGWRERIQAAGGHVTEVRDRDYFRSVYFREPRGVLFEIATLSPGFAVDEDPDHLGEALRVPKRHDDLREQLQRTLIPLVNPRTARSESAAR